MYSIYHSSTCIYYLHYNDIFCVFVKLFRIAVPQIAFRTLEILCSSLLKPLKLILFFKLSLKHQNKSELAWTVAWYPLGIGIHSQLLGDFCGKYERGCVYFQGRREDEQLCVIFLRPTLPYDCYSLLSCFYCVLLRFKSIFNVLIVLIMQNVLEKPAGLGWKHSAKILFQINEMKEMLIVITAQKTMTFVP